MDILSRFNDAQSRLVLQTSDLPLGTLAQMVDREVIDLVPAFQRRERWNVVKQSALIESFILNVPVPPIFLSEDDYGRYSAIDGKQRLKTITDFIYNRFELVELEGFSELNGYKFENLPSDIQNALMIRPFLRVVTLLKQSDPNLKYEVFTRLNRGGEALNAQEIRNVAFRGPLNDLIYNLSENKFLWERLKIADTNSASYKEMIDAEFVLRFLALHELRRSYKGSLLKSMDNFMLKYRDSKQNRLDVFRRNFETALERCENIWGEHAFQRPTGDGWREQTLSGMFDAQMLAVSELTEEQYQQILNCIPSVVDETRKLFLDEEFEKSVREGTNTPSRLSYRVSSVHEMLAKISR